ncbi:stage 0 sporulation protein J [Oceanobacillus oncorhynchi subsp. incaldanensis]|uniref:ParB/RepB/Spo0J family partition protein n=2 Tax=Oceanobacillus TaxID=182709 RepID=A0ABV9JT35_9BACI|nr:ParB/RepB/Spo0J family partition protein [Oceanobacillus oncorhynchi]MDM8101400.1 ParB/RepB/Spo0J family partition protein [Oceanobacillus oncorhynchi]UUI40032.1 ParB/RepB/Spo0J family partition protein [Oceanobacillus oncorhynchi]GIO20155.1 stage 0 sporulation protein J [Oceanobacillus oncorhynchi subsp. incaldanensis]CEI80305.1 putative chromosome-partitioning protein ParB [Oceanobacillus oncorhynchi]
MQRGLGKGINALFPEAEKDSKDNVQEIELSHCRPNPYQPRKSFQADSIEELKDSIKEYGVIQPIIVRKSLKGFEIVVGERRCRAAKEAGLETIPAIVRELTDERMMEIALLENLQRENLTPIEEAQAYANLVDRLNITQHVLAERLGKSRSHIANMIRLLSLPEEVIAHINNGELSMGHGRALLGLKEQEAMLAVANKIRNEKLNVRQAEKLIIAMNEKQVKQQKKKPKKDVFIQERETVLRDTLGTAVHIHKGKKKGKIEIEFYNDDDLNRILEYLEK